MLGTVLGQRKVECGEALADFHLCMLMWNLGGEGPHSDTAVLKETAVSSAHHQGLSREEVVLMPSLDRNKFIS